MQAESSLWDRKRVVGSKLKHDGTLGYISRGAARRSGLNPADAQKDEGEQGDGAETTHTNETTTTPSAR